MDTSVIGDRMRGARRADKLVRGLRRKDRFDRGELRADSRSTDLRVAVHEPRLCEGLGRPARDRHRVVPRGGADGLARANSVLRSALRIERVGIAGQGVTSQRVETRAVSIRTVALGQAGVDGVSHFVVCQQFFERVAVEQRGALVAEFWDFDFDAINLFGTIEDASDAQKLVVAALNDLVTQRFDDTHFASHSERGRVQQAVTRTRVSASAFVKAR